MSTPYCVVLDSNAWVAERLLQSSIGSAFLYAVTGANNSVGLPQVVEMEVSRVLEKQCEDAVHEIQKAIRLLRQIADHGAPQSAPSVKAIREGIALRWKNLDGTIRRIAFSHEHALAALHRINKGLAPAGPNNEQFRDCCIWEATKMLASDRTVHFISNDAAFYENRDRKQGLAKVLLNEVATCNLDVRLYPTIAAFLEAAGEARAVLDEAAIAAAIVDAVKSVVIERATYSGGSAPKLELLGAPRIKGYATPKPSTIAVSFESSYRRTRVDDDREVVSQVSISGTCSYDPNTRTVSEIDIQRLSDYLPGYASIFNFRSEHLQRLVYEGRQRLIE